MSDWAGLKYAINVLKPGYNNIASVLNEPFQTADRDRASIV